MGLRWPRVENSMPSSASQFTEPEPLLWGRAYVALRPKPWKAIMLYILTLRNNDQTPEAKLEVKTVANRLQAFQIVYFTLTWRNKPSSLPLWLIQRLRHLNTSATYVARVSLEE